MRRGRRPEQQEMRKTLGHGVSIRHGGNGHMFSELGRSLLSHGEMTQPAFCFMVLEKSCDWRQWHVRFGRRRSGGEKADNAMFILKTVVNFWKSPCSLTPGSHSALPHPVLLGPLSPQHLTCCVNVFLPLLLEGWLLEVWGHGWPV